MLQLEFGHFPVLVTERLVLREPQLADSSAFFSLRSDPEVMRYIDRPLAQTEDEVVALIEKIRENYRNNEAIFWVISLKDNPAFIGNISFWRIDKENYRAEIGYMIDPAFQGKGIAGEAIDAVLNYGFQSLKFHSVEGHVNPGNAASIRVLERAGFVREAYFRENYYFDGRFLDSAVYSLVASN